MYRWRVWLWKISYFISDYGSAAKAIRTVDALKLDGVSIESFTEKDMSSIEGTRWA